MKLWLRRTLLHWESYELLASGFGPVYLLTAHSSLLKVQSLKNKL